MGCCESSYPYTKLFWRADVASAKGDIKEVQKYFQKKKQSFLIHWLFQTAVHNNQTNIIDFLLQNGVYQERYADYSLRYLTKEGHAKRGKSIAIVTRKQLQSMNVYDFLDVTIPRNCDTELIKKLIVNANYNCHSYNDYLFQNACLQQDVDTVNLIVSFDKAPKNKHILLHIFYLMCSHGNVEIVRILLALKQRHLINVHVGFISQFNKEKKMLLNYC
jgi:hypothetical protein